MNDLAPMFNLWVAFFFILTSALFTLWMLAIIKVIRKGYFKIRPSHEEFLRNIVYLSKR